MKMISKNIVMLVSGLLLMGMLLVPSVSLAQVGRNQGSTTRPALAENFCPRIGEFEGNKFSQRIDERHHNLTVKRGERLNTLDDKRHDRDGKLAGNRTEAAARRQAQFAGLEARAKTDAEKQAVADFKTAINNAITARQAAIDDAIAAFRTGLDGAIGSHASDFDAARTALKSSVDAAVAKAKADCGSGVNGKTARETLMASIKDARDTFQTAVASIEKPKINRADLAANRKTAIAKAAADFKVAVEKARADLKAVFKD